MTSTLTSLDYNVLALLCSLAVNLMLIWFLVREMDDNARLRDRVAELEERLLEELLSDRVSFAEMAVL